MNRDVLIGVDAGTSVVKAVAFAQGGRQIAVCGKPNRYVRVAGGGVEQDMRATWDDAAEMIRALADAVPGLAGRVAALAVTGQGDGTWLIDAAGEPPAPAWLWLDARAGAVAEEIVAGEFYSTQYATTGTGINACQQSAQLLWMKRNRPDLLRRAATAFHCKDWLYFRLTGARATDPSEGCFTFGDFRTRGYAPEILHHLGAPDLARLLPPIVDGAAERHGLTGEASRATGLPSGTPVVLGYVDVVCTGLGGGLFSRDAGAGCSIIGSTGMHMRLAPAASEVRLNAERSGYTMPFPVPGHFAQMQSNMAATLNIDWLLDIAREILAREGVERSRGDLVAGLDAAVLDAEPGAALFHPYISEAGERGPFMDPAARAQFSGLSAPVGYCGMLRTILEGLAFAARDCYAAMGPMPREVCLAGGAARSRAMRTILSSVLGAPVRTTEREEAGAAGAAMIAAVQQGFYPDMFACADEWVEPLLCEPVTPDAALAARYDALFDVYRDTREAMRPLWRALLAAREASGAAAPRARSAA